MHNGNLEDDHTRPAMVKEGSFTDFNVWDSFLPETDMEEFTLCRSNMAGNLLPWNGNDWEMSSEIEPNEYQVSEMEFKEICSPPSKFALFQEKVTFPEADQVIVRSVPNSKESWL